LAEYRIPEVALTTDYSIDVLRGSRDDGSHNLVLRITEQVQGSVTWLLIGNPENARKLGIRLIEMASELEHVRAAEEMDQGE
jgi:hypothetical protein